MPQPGRVVIVGNSLSAPSGWPELLATALGWGATVTFTNNAVSGQKMQAIIANAAATDALLGAGKNVLVVWEVTNDMFEGGQHPHCFHRLLRYCADRQIAGWTVVVLTVTPRSDAGTPAAHETWRLAVNTLIRSWWNTFATAMVDVAADTRLDDETDATYYVDLVHMTAAGKQVVVDLVRPTIEALFA